MVHMKKPAVSYNGWHIFLNMKILSRKGDAIMKNLMQDTSVYETELGLDGTPAQLVDWAYRYSADFTDDALIRIAEIAKERGGSEKDQQTPLLVLAVRQREAKADDSLPYEAMKLDILHDMAHSWEETRPYGEVELRVAEDKVYLAVIGRDTIGDFVAQNAVPLSDFMGGDAGYLEKLVGETLFYGKVYDADTHIRMDG